MKKFNIYFEETEIESLEALIANPDPSRIKMYGGGDAYVNMLKKKLENARKKAAIHDHLKKSPLSPESAEDAVNDELKDVYYNEGQKKGLKGKDLEEYVEDKMTQPGPHG